MFSLVSKRVLRDSVYRVSANKTLVSLSSMRFAGDVRKLDEKEKGDERLYFTKQEGKYKSIDNHISTTLHQFFEMDLLIYL